MYCVLCVYICDWVPSRTVRLSARPTFVRLSDTFASSGFCPTLSPLFFCTLCVFKKLLNISWWDSQRQQPALCSVYCPPVPKLKTSWYPQFKPLSNNGSYICSRPRYFKIRSTIATVQFLKTNLWLQTGGGGRLSAYCSSLVRRPVGQRRGSQWFRQKTRTVLYCR